MNFGSALVLAVSTLAFAGAVVVGKIGGHWQITRRLAGAAYYVQSDDTRAPRRMVTAELVTRTA